MRKLSRLITVPLEEPFRKLLIRQLNLIFGRSSQSDRFWEEEIKIGVAAKFEQGLTEVETTKNYSLRSIIAFFQLGNGDGRHYLLGRIQELMGFKLRAPVSKILDVALESPEPFGDTILDEIGEKIKHLQVVASAEGAYFIDGGWC
jgi:hypothetical protein